MEPGTFQSIETTEDGMRRSGSESSFPESYRVYDAPLNPIPVLSIRRAGVLRNTSGHLSEAESIDTLSTFGSDHGMKRSQSVQSFASSRHSSKHSARSFATDDMDRVTEHRRNIPPKRQKSMNSNLSNDEELDEWLDAWLVQLKSGPSPASMSVATSGDTPLRENRASLERLAAKQVAMETRERVLRGGDDDEEATERLYDDDEESDHVRSTGTSSTGRLRHFLANLFSGKNADNYQHEFDNPSSGVAPPPWINNGEALVQQDSLPNFLQHHHRAGLLATKSNRSELSRMTGEWNSEASKRNHDTWRTHAFRCMIIFLFVALSVCIGVGIAFLGSNDPYSPPRPVPTNAPTTTLETSLWRTSGDNWVGDVAGEEFGDMLATNGDGTTVVAAGVITQAVRVASLDADGRWQSKGTLPVQKVNALAMNDDGDIVAAGRVDGSVQVFQYNQARREWSQQGSELSFPLQLTQVVTVTVDLSAAGTTLAFGVVTNEQSLLIAVVDYDPTINDWVQNRAEVRRANLYTHASVSLSSDGSIMAVAHVSDETTGTVEVWRQIGTNWVTIGSPGDNFAALSQTSLSNDGQTLAIAMEGKSRIYRYDPSTGVWDQVGQSMESAVHVSLSDDARRVALADVARYSIWDWDETIWRKVHQGDQLYPSIALSDDGSRLAVGTPLFRSSSTTSSSVPNGRVFVVSEAQL